jgi:hypothetical protein
MVCGHDGNPDLLPREVVYKSEKLATVVRNPTAPLTPHRTREHCFVTCFVRFEDTSSRFIRGSP